jgi:hypothetical protein
MLNNYKRKEVWVRNGKDFLIEVVRWETMTEEQYNKLKLVGATFNGRFVWNVYCYLYPNHRKFDLAKEEGYGDCPVNALHYGCTFVKWHLKTDGTITSKQYGSDYNHYQDERFTYIEKPEDAYAIFNDAEELFEELS